MSLPVTLNEVERGFLTDAETSAATLPGKGLDWLSALRTDAMKTFESRGLPHRRVEEWKYTDLRQKLAHPYAPAPAADAAIDLAALTPDPFAGIEGPLVMIVNGYFRADLSQIGDLPAGVEIVSFAQALETGGAWLEAPLRDAPAPDRHAVNGLNLALARDGVVIRVAADVAMTAPIRVVHVSSGEAAVDGRAVHVRHLAVLEKGAKATLLESHCGANGQDRLSTIGLTCAVGDGANLSHYKAQGDGDAAVHVGLTTVDLGAGSQYNGFHLTTGGLMTRNEVTVRFKGAEGFARVSGATALADRQHCDTTAVIDHAVADCNSRQVFKSVLADRARAVYQGKVIVRQDAQRTDGYQLSNALLLSPGVEMDTKPELEIYADDVKCSHGATASDLDEDSLFYLQSRGIDEHGAKSLLVTAFLAEAIEEVEDEGIRTALATHVAAWLEAHKAQLDNAAASPGSEANAA